VLDGKQVVGNLSDATLAREMHHGTSLGQKTVREIMDLPLMQVDLDTDIHEVYRLLKRGQPGLIVTGENVPVGFLNRLDLVDYWKRQIA
jgi:predicted transcriptional regulator